MKYTLADFSCADAPKPVRHRIAQPEDFIRLRPIRRFPAAPPSPTIYDNVVTEPFPDFVDERSPSDQSDPHCALHCKHLVCSYIIYRPRTPQEPSKCTCADGNDSCSSAYSPTLAPFLPVDSTTLPPLSLQDDHIITLNLTDSLVLFRHLKYYTDCNESRTAALAQALVSFYPYQADEMVQELVNMFFSILNTYFRRTISAGNRTMTVGDLKRELQVYIWTLLRDFVYRYAPNERVEDYWNYMIEGCQAPLPALYELDKSKGLGAVAAFWMDLGEEFVALVATRSEELKRLELEQEQKEEEMRIEMEIEMQKKKDQEEAKMRGIVLDRGLVLLVGVFVVAQVFQYFFG